MAEDGFPPGGGVEVLGVKVHASIVKAAAIVGIGRKNCIDLDDGYLKFDLVKLEARLKANVEAGKGSIIVVGAGEVNTGNLSTQMKELRALADKYPGSWIHIDAAFGAFAALLPEFDSMSKDFALADSLTADGALAWLYHASRQPDLIVNCCLSHLRAQVAGQCHSLSPWFTSIDAFLAP